MSVRNNGKNGLLKNEDCTHCRYNCLHVTPSHPEH